MAHKISPLQLFMLLTTFIGLSNHVILIPILLDVASRDSWVSVLLSIAPSLLWGLLFRYLYKRMPASLPGWIYQKTKSWVWFILTAMFTGYFLFSASITIKDTILWSNASYLTYTPPYVIGFCLIGMCYYTARKGLMAIAITNGILLPFIVLFGLYVMTVNFQFKDYSYLFPVFKNPVSHIAKGAWYTTSGITEMIIMLFLKDEVQGPISKKFIWILVLFLAELTFGPLVGAIAMFGPFEASFLRYPAYEQWRMASIGNMLSQTDFLSIYQWLAGSFIRISLSMHILYIMWIKKWNRPEWLMLIIASVFFSLNLIKLGDMRFHSNVKYYYELSSVFNGLVTVVLLICLWIGIHRSKKGA